MIDFTKISTENFYKFLTVLGLVIFCYCSYMIADRFVKSRDVELDSVQKRLELQNEKNNLNDKELLLKLNLCKVFHVGLSTIDSLCKHFNNYNVPDSLISIAISNDFVELQKLKHKLDLDTDLIALYKTKKEDSDFYSKFVIPILFIAFIIGFAFFVIGFYNWYFRHQRLKNKKLYIEYLKLDKVYNVCQSCGRLMNYDTERPKEKEGSLNFKFCCDCYKDGEFVDVELTKEEFRKMILGKIRFKNKVNIWFRMFGFDNLLRWK